MDRWEPVGEGEKDPLLRWKGFAGSIHSFTRKGFVTLGQQMGRERYLGVRKFMKLFDCFSGDNARIPLTGAGIDCGTMLEGLGAEELGRLYDSMKNMASLPSPESLPCLGKRYFEHLFKDSFVRYKKITGLHTYDEDGTKEPWAIEMVTYRSGTVDGHCVDEFVNFSYMGSKRPFSAWDYEVGMANGHNHSTRRTSIYELAQKSGLSILIHGISPNFRMVNSRSFGTGVLTSRWSPEVGQRGPRATCTLSSAPSAPVQSPPSSSSSSLTTDLW